MPRVLIVKLGAIGDVLMAIPAAYQLHLAGHPIDWLCGPAVVSILELYPWIRPIPVDDRALLRGSLGAKLRALLAAWRTLRAVSAGQSHALIATLYYDRRYRLLTLLVAASRRLQLSPNHRHLSLIPGRHHTDEFARILLSRRDQVTPASFAPIPVPASALPPCSIPEPSRPRIVLVPAGARNLLADDALRRWPVEHYLHLARLLLAQDAEVLLIGGPGDEWVRPSFAALPVLDLIGQLALPETLALLNSADVTVTHDTGPLHLAGVTRTGIVALFGPTNPHEKLPQRPGTVALWGGESFACRPCYDGRTFAPCPANDCLRQLTPELVLEEVLSMLHDRAQGILVPPQVRVPSRAQTRVQVRVPPPSTAPDPIPPAVLVHIAERHA